jgi:hypothetical protein
MMHMIRRIAVVIVLTFASAASSQTYLVPDGDCGAVTLRASSGSAARVDQAWVFPPNRRIEVKPAAVPGSLTFNAEVPDQGVVMAGVDFKPEVAGNETRTEHAKVMIFCGAATPVADWQRSVGLDLEIYPQGWNGPRPHLKAGDPMRFIAVDRATKTLLRDVPMQLYNTQGALIADGTPAEHGGMNFPYQPPGRYTVVTTYRRADPQRPEHWLVDTSTLTFDIK